MGAVTAIRPETAETCSEQQKSLEKFIKKNVDFSNILKKMDKLMDNANLWHLRNQIFEDLSHEDVLNCRRVCKYWNESLRRLSDVKFIQEFGERVVEETNEKLSTLIPGWKNAAQKYGVQASMDDIEKVKDLLKKLARGKGKCVNWNVPEWVKVENIEDFIGLCEINCKGDEEIKDMVELRRKIKNRVSFPDSLSLFLFKEIIFIYFYLQDAAQRSRQKRIEGTKKLQFQNVDYSGPGNSL